MQVHSIESNDTIVSTGGDYDIYEEVVGTGHTGDGKQFKGTEFDNEIMKFDPVNNTWVLGDISRKCQ